MVKRRLVQSFFRQWPSRKLGSYNAAVILNTAHYHGHNKESAEEHEGVRILERPERFVDYANRRNFYTEGYTHKDQVMVDKMLRVDHAGEFGAVEIYSGQIAVLKDSSVAQELHEMKQQEVIHLEVMEKLINEHRVRPTALLPLWKIAGFALGAGTALLGKEAAMACTVAVEEVISEHYNDQIRELYRHDNEDLVEIRKVFRRFRDEELEHRDIGIDNNAEQAPAYKLLSQLIKSGCKAAIFITERI